MFRKEDFELRRLLERLPVDQLSERFEREELAYERKLFGPDY